MSDDERFISPSADAYQERQAAARLDSLDGARIGMVDSMLNPSALWGQGCSTASRTRSGSAILMRRSSVSIARPLPAGSGRTSGPRP